MTEIAQWKEELNTYRPIQKLFILEGNVSDLQLLTEGIESGELVSLNEYLHTFLVAQGYHSIVFFNRIDGFRNKYDKTGKMLEIFNSQAELENPSRKPDIQTAMTGIRRALGKTEHSTAVIIEMAGQLIGSAEHLEESETEYLSILQLAVSEALSGKADNADRWANNLVFMITNKVQELPTWFYRYSPYTKVLTLEHPREAPGADHILS